MLRMRFLLIIPLSLAVFTVCAEEVKLLSLQDAILLGLRYNANVRTAELNRVVQKFQLEVAQWQFQPHYSFSAGDSWSTSRYGNQFSPMTQTWSATPGVSWNSPIGTTVTASESNSWAGHNHFSPATNVTITQPLISGFGEAVVEAGLEEAYDTEKTNKLGLKSTIMSQVTSTISAYMTVVGAENSVEVDQESLDRAKTNLFQTKLYIQAGQNPQSDQVQAEAQVAQAMSQLQLDKSALVIAKYSLLQTIGLEPTSNIRVLHDVPLEKYHLLSEEESIKKTLENNIDYQTAVIQIATASRGVMQAKDANRWSLDLTETYNRGGYVNSPASIAAPVAAPMTASPANTLGGGFNSLIGNTAYGSTTGLTLTVPIDAKDKQGSLLSAEIGLEAAQLNLKQAKQTLIIQTMSSRDSLVNAETQIQLEESQVKLDQQTLQNTQRSYRAGMSSSLQVTQQSQTLANDQRLLVTAKIGYFEALASFDQMYGHTLDTWGIHVQY